MIAVVLQLIFVFAAGAILGSIVHWATQAFAWQPRQQDSLGYRSWLIRTGVGLALAGLYWWEVVRLGLVQGQFPLAIAPPTGPLCWQFVSHAILFCLMLTASLIDIDERIIPDGITVSGTLLGLMLATSVPMSLLPHLAERQDAPVVGVQVGQPGGGLWVDQNRSLWLEPVTVVAPNRWPPAWGDPQNWGSLAIGLACYLLWCFALTPRIWRGRRGWPFALWLVLLRVIRELMRPPMRWLLFFGAVGVTLTWTAARRWPILCEPAWCGLITALAGLVVSGGMVWAVRLIGTAALRREAMGFGDVTLMMMIGTFLGWQACLVAFFLAPFAGLVVGIAQFALRREDVIPYGPFLCVGAAAVVVFWAPIWTWAQPLFQLGWLIPATVAVCLPLLGVMLAIWRFIKGLLFGGA